MKKNDNMFLEENFLRIHDFNMALEQLIEQSKRHIEKSIIDSFKEYDQEFNWKKLKTDHEFDGDETSIWISIPFKEIKPKKNIIYDSLELGIVFNQSYLRYKPSDEFNNVTASFAYTKSQFNNKEKFQQYLKYFTENISAEIIGDDIKENVVYEDPDNDNHLLISYGGWINDEDEDALPMLTRHRNFPELINDMIVCGKEFIKLLKGVESLEKK